MFNKFLWWWWSSSSFALAILLSSTKIPSYALGVALHFALQIFPHALESPSTSVWGGACRWRSIGGANYGGVPSVFVACHGPASAARDRRSLTSCFSRSQVNAVAAAQINDRIWYRGNRLSHAELRTRIFSCMRCYRHLDIRYSWWMNWQKKNGGRVRIPILLAFSPYLAAPTHSPKLDHICLGFISHNPARPITFMFT